MFSLAFFLGDFNFIAVKVRKFEEEHSVTHFVTTFSLSACKIKECGKKL
jgi:hypothetical protein